jgi:E3 ubiquitin-protein ligase HERC1
LLGIDKTFDKKFLRMVNWKYLEYRVVGSPVVNITRLKEITSYEKCSEDHEVVKRFWKVLEEFSNEEKIMYLRFVWGRTRLPLEGETNVESHKILFDELRDKKSLPLGKTCFFKLHLPPYESEKALR